MNVQQLLRNPLGSLGLTLCLMSGGVSAATVTITIEGDMSAFNMDPYTLHGAHYKWVTTIDTTAVAYVQNSFSTYDTAYYRYFDTSIDFTGRPGGAADASATIGTTVQTVNYNSTSLNTDSMFVSSSGFSAPFSGLTMNQVDFFFTPDVYGPDGFANIPAGWLPGQLLDNLFDGEFFVGGVTEYTSFNTSTLVEVSAVPVPAAVWLFVSGLIGLAGVTRRNRCRATQAM